MNESLRDSVELVAGIPIVVLVPPLVELAKRHGLPTRWAGIAAILLATLLLVLGDLALGDRGGAGWLPRFAVWLIGGVVYGLAASGLYSQRGVLPGALPGAQSPGERVG